MKPKKNYQICVRLDQKEMSIIDYLSDILESDASGVVRTALIKFGEDYKVINPKQLGERQYSELQGG